MRRYPQFYSRQITHNDFTGSRARTRRFRKRLAAKDARNGSAVRWRNYFSSCYCTGKLSSIFNDRAVAPCDTEDCRNDRRMLFIATATSRKSLRITPFIE